MHAAGYPLGLASSSSSEIISAAVGKIGVAHRLRVLQSAEHEPYGKPHPAVYIEAAHLCTQMRGVEEEGSRTVTTFWRGLYDEDADLRREFLDEVRARRSR